MSRFPPARRTAIAVWTSASVLWAATLTALTMEPAADSAPEGNPRSLETPAPSSGAMPNRPPSGLIVVRAPASETQDTSTRTQVTQTAVPAPVPASAPAPPQPVSSGS